MNIDFAAIKASVSIEQGIKLLGITMKGDVQKRSPCPCGNGGDRALTINTERGSFFCHGIKKGGSVLDLISHVKGISLRDAAAFIAKESGTVSTVSHTSTRPEAAERKGFDPTTYLKSLDPSHEALSALGISAPTLTSFNAGYSSTGINRGRLAVQVGNHFMGVSLKGEQPRLLFPKDFDPRSLIFGLDRVTQPEIRIVKDVLQVMASAEYGEEAIAFLTDTTDHTQDEMLAAAKRERHFTTFYE